MITPVDPSWLPSTVAQSTAALVGIIGGLLVARFMSIDADQKSLRAHEVEASERLKFVTEVRDGLQARGRRELAISVLSTRTATRMILTPPFDADRSASEFLDSVGEDGWEPTEFAPYLAEAMSVAMACVSGIVQSIRTQGGLSRTWQSLRRELGLPEDDWDGLRAEMHDQLKFDRKRQLEQEEAARKRDAAARSPKGILFGAHLADSLMGPRFTPELGDLLPASSFESAARAADVQRMRSATDDVSRAQFEHDLAVRALKDSALPSSLMVAVWMLIGLTIIGLVLPVFALFAMRSYGNETWRLSVLVAFCVGIAGLLVYLYVSASRLGSKAVEDSDSDQS